MTLLNGITLLLVYQLLGEVCAVLLHLPVPGPVLGMLMLFVTLLLRQRSMSGLDVCADGLLSHLSLLFVPAGVGIMVHADRIAAEWLPIALTLLLSTVITMAVTAGVMLGAMRLLGRSGSADE